MYCKAKGGREEFLRCYLIMVVCKNNTDKIAAHKESLLPRLLDYAFEESDFAIEK